MKVHGKEIMNVVKEVIEDIEVTEVIGVIEEIEVIGVIEDKEVIEEDNIEIIDNTIMHIKKNKIMINNFE